MRSLFDLVMLALNVVQFVVIAHVIMSWLISFRVLNPYQPIVGQIWQLLNRLLEPIYAPIRRMIPLGGGLDFSPLVVLLAVYLIQQLVLRNAVMLL